MCMISSLQTTRKDFCQTGAHSEVYQLKVFPHLDVGAVVSGQINSEGERLVLANLSKHLHDPVMLCRFRRLNDGTHG